MVPRVTPHHVLPFDTIWPTPFCCGYLVLPKQIAMISAGDLKHVVFYVLVSLCPWQMPCYEKRNEALIQVLFVPLGTKLHTLLYTVEGVD